MAIGWRGAALMNYALYNQQLLQRYTYDECILRYTSQSTFVALQAGERVSIKNCNETLVGGAVLSLMIALALAATSVVLKDIDIEILLVAAVPIVPLGIHNFYTIRRLNDAWTNGKLLVSQPDEIDKPSNDYYSYSVICEFVAPNGERISKRFDTNSPPKWKAPPVVFMLYKNAKDCLIL